PSESRGRASAIGAIPALPKATALPDKPGGMVDNGTITVIAKIRAGRSGGDSHVFIAIGT
ncbi:hypothetical protein J0J19_23290, partial [Vibrio vulnificus]|uniref:hypothetical protein n=1 Tax=Vibrio vulnificus TaxID=672 RepID=UPI0019D47785